METDLATLYGFRFSEAERPGKVKLWETLCRHYFQGIVGDGKVVLDLACGYGEFINAIKAKEKIAVDLNADVAKFLGRDVKLLQCSADSIPLDAAVVDVAFASNFLEHLRTKEECNAVLAEVRRVLRPGGRFIIMGPNIRYLADRYWDFYDHYLPLSHLSLTEGLVQARYEVDQVIPRFLPYTAKSRIPQHEFLVALYLKVPLAWRFMGRQFLVVGRKPLG